MTSAPRPAVHVGGNAGHVTLEESHEASTSHTPNRHTASGACGPVVSHTGAKHSSSSQAGGGSPTWTAPHVQQSLTTMQSSSSSQGVGGASSVSTFPVSEVPVSEVPDEPGPVASPSSPAPSPSSEAPPSVPPPLAEDVPLADDIPLVPVASPSATTSV